MAIVIRGGVVVNASGEAEADVRIEGERITGVGADLHQPGDQILDASGCRVMPGGIDPHTHIEMPAGDLGFTADTWESATAAAVAGGTTCVIDMITQERGESLGAALQDWQRRAGPQAHCDYSFHMGIIDPRPAVLAEMGEIVAAGVPSFKIYLAYKGRLMISDDEALRIMQEAGRLGAWTLVHAENGDLIEELIADARAAGRLGPEMHPATRPPHGEGEATARAIDLGRHAGAPVYIVHVSCRDALGAIARARKAGQRVAAEACLHHLVLTDEEYRRPGLEAAPFVLSPPLRSEVHRLALWAGLESGTLDLVATDHCPWNLEGQKERGEHDFTLIPNGGPGLEERMAVLYTAARGSWTPAQFVARTSANAARIFGLKHKGAVAPGFDADLVVWDPNVESKISAATQHGGVDHSLYEGMAVRGQCRFTLVRGRVAAVAGKPVGAPGWGRQPHRCPQ